MTESSTCVMHAFSYASPIPNEAKPGNSMHALGESISFGRYMIESLSYVEEAKSYAQPGSVAQKKAFFEAHYKNIAARKAAATALLAQQANPEPQESRGTRKGSFGTETKAVISEKPLLKKTLSKKRQSSNFQKVPKVVPSSPGNLRKAKNVPIIQKAIAGPTKEKPLEAVKQKMESCVIEGSNYNKNCSTPLRTPSETCRTKSQMDNGPKWHILTAFSKSLTGLRKKLQSPNVSTPFLLRTEERAAKRKQKLEEKFNAKEEEKVQLQTKFKEKAETELKKLRQSICFKARPLPHFYKRKETTKTQINKTQAIHPQSNNLGKKSIASKSQDMISSKPPLISSSKKDVSKKITAKKQNTSYIINFNSQKGNVTSHENASPNIQH